MNKEQILMRYNSVKIIAGTLFVILIIFVIAGSLQQYELNQCNDFKERFGELLLKEKVDEFCSQQTYPVEIATDIEQCFFCVSDDHGKTRLYDKNVYYRNKETGEITKEVMRELDDFKGFDDAYECCFNETIEEKHFYTSSLIFDNYFVCVDIIPECPEPEFCDLDNCKLNERGYFSCKLGMYEYAIEDVEISEEFDFELLNFEDD